MPKKNKILIVDDERVNLDLLYTALHNKYQVAVATNGQRAIQLAISDNPPDLILLDIMMPETDGYEVLKTLKKSDTTKHIPVIFITAKIEYSDEIYGLELGAVDYIPKPFNMAVVQQRIANHLELKRHRDNLQVLVKERTLDLETANIKLQEEINEKIDAQKKLLQANEQLEQRVLERTYDLTKTNLQLEQEIIERKKTELKLKELLKKQEINIEIAKHLLSLTNAASLGSSGYIPISERYVLFCKGMCLPCYAEGGDHYFIRTFSDKGKIKTVFSIKDQSGHDVECVLRSIATDMIYHRILDAAVDTHDLSLDKTIENLNNQIIQSKMFKGDQFLTAVCAEIDHETLALKYLLAGHPHFLLIRNRKVMPLPSLESEGVNPPIGIINDIKYNTAEFALKPNDALILYTDGLIEMPVKKGKEVISKDQLVEILQNIVETNPNIHVSEMMNLLITTIAKYSDEDVIPFVRNSSDDDITVLAFEIEDKNERSVMISEPFSSYEISDFVGTLYKAISEEWTQKGYQNPELRLYVLLEEMIINAWKHGNKKSNKKIEVRWRFGNDFHLEVIDEGEGFDITKVPDPTKCENLTKCEGRGLFIIRNFAKSIIWLNNGNHIVVTLAY